MVKIVILSFLIVKEKGKHIVCYLLLSCKHHHQSLFFYYRLLLHVTFILKKIAFNITLNTNGFTLMTFKYGMLFSDVCVFIMKCFDVGLAECDL